MTELQDALNTPPSGWLRSDKAWRQQVTRSRENVIAAAEERRRRKRFVSLPPAYVSEPRGPLLILWDVTDVLRLVSVQVHEPDCAQPTRRQRFWLARSRDRHQSADFIGFTAASAAMAAVYITNVALGGPVSWAVAFGVAIVTGAGVDFGVEHAIHREATRLPEIRLTENEPDFVECTLRLMQVLSDTDRCLKDEHPYAEILAARDAAWYLIWALAGLQTYASSLVERRDFRPRAEAHIDFPRIVDSTRELVVAMEIWTATYDDGRDEPAHKAERHTQTIRRAAGSASTTRRRSLQDRVDYAVTYADLAIAELTEAVSV